MYSMYAFTPTIGTNPDVGDRGDIIAQHYRLKGALVLADVSKLLPFIKEMPAAKTLTPHLYSHKHDVDD